MNAGEVNWFDKAADWAWLLLVGIVTAAIALARRVFSHEARLKALESAFAEAREDDARSRESFERRIDQNYDRVIDAIDKMREKYDEDYRLVLSELLQRVPRA